MDAENNNKDMRAASGSSSNNVDLPTVKNNKKITTNGDEDRREDSNNNHVVQDSDPVAEDPRRKKDINNAGIGNLADNDNASPSEDGVGQEGGAMAVLEDQEEVEDNNNVEVILALSDGDISMEIAATVSNIQDTIGEGLVAEYDDNVLRMQPARFPDGQHNFFTTHVRDTVGDVNGRLDSVFGADAVVLGFVDGDRVIRATPTSVVDDIIGYSHIRLAFGYGNEMADDGD